MNEPERLIAALAGGLTPVARWKPAWLRALGWGVLALPLGVVAVLAVFGRHVQLEVAPLSWPALAVIGSLALGLLSIGAAYALTVPGRHLPGRALALGGLLAWAALSWLQFLSARPDPGSWGQGLYCYLFILLAGTPMLAVFVLALRRSGALWWPRQASWLAGLGAFYAAAALLSLCHPAHATVMDLVAHLLAGLTLAGAAWAGSTLIAGGGRRR